MNSKQSYKMNNFNYQLISEKIWDEINLKFSIRGGVYKIFLISDDVRIPINRFLGTDQNGILYIGKASSFLDRVINLKKSIIYDSISHEFADRFKNHKGIIEAYTIDNIYIELLESDNPRELELIELNKYLDVFGELPPMNRVR